MTEQLIEIGKRLYALRDIMEISQEDMSEKMKISLDEYRAHERGEKDFSFSFLHNAAEVLGVDVLDIMSGESPKLSRCTLVRKGKGYDIVRRKEYDYKHLAFTFRKKKAEPFLVTIEPKPEEVKPDQHAHEGQEFNYILKGSVNFYLEDDVYELHEGDSVYFDSGKYHALRAIDGKPAKLIAIVMK
ncbi:MAG: XRE family transcriptional regulator [Lachnoclostridium sp.]|jgi:mannose-6-phosphate isomerase-like protein (cupin superfamily)|nr:XRE family transcriptional regulator [Lachnoclostridium sp.]